MPDERSSDDDLGATLHAEMFELWIEPELARRGDLDRSLVRRALVTMDATGPAVRLNEEFTAVATVRATRPIRAGEDVTLNDFSEVNWVAPVEIDPNVGWILYVVVGTDAYVTFDLRANVERATTMLDLADQYITAALHNRIEERLGPAIDSALSAAELAVKAELHLLGTPERDGHGVRLAFWGQWVRQGNAPAHLADTFARLTRERGAARYADRGLSMDSEEVAAAIAEVQDMISAVRDHTTSRGHTLNLHHAG